MHGRVVNVLYVLKLEIKNIYRSDVYVRNATE